MCPPNDSLEVTSTEPPATTTTDAPPPSNTAPPVEGSSPPPGVTEPPAYTPNFKFKVMDKEHEIPEMYRGLLKDPDTEKQVRETFEKSYGLDTVKARFQETREQFQTTRQELEAYKGQVSNLRELYQRGDLDGFFTQMKIPVEKILQYAYDKLSLDKLPPEQRQVHDRQQAAERRAYDLERSLQQAQQTHEQHLVDAKRQGLIAGLEKPDVKTFAETFDARMGKAGAFIEEVIGRGEMASVMYGKDISPDQAIREVMALYGLGSSPAATAGAPVAQGGQKAPPTIPNVSGRSTSPMPAKPKSIEDLKKLYKASQAQA